jgi:adenylate kinase
LYHISTGEVLRAQIAAGTELGKTADAFISKGQLIPDDLMVKILANVLDTHAADKKGVVFDGFPRTIPQAHALKELLRERGMDLTAVIGLEVPEDELVQRMIKRGQDTGRADDTPETIQNRLKVYHSQTEPLKQHYIASGDYVAIDGKGGVDQIFNDIVAGIEPRFK